jgi:peptide/nickel transport system substrate-binding protein
VPVRFPARLLLLLLATGCVRGHAQTTADAGSSAAAAAAAEDDWTAGRLPASVNEGTPQKGGTLVVRLQAMPPSLDLITDSDLITEWILDRRVYESLAALDEERPPDYPLAPSLAERWEVSPDGRLITFHIRHGVRWHDGQPFTGQDVVATVRKILDPNVRAIHLRSKFEDLDSIDTLPGDDFTVVAKYRKTYFLALRTLATQPIYPKHVLDAAGTMLSAPIHRAPVGTGPFRFSAWTESDGRIEFVRNEDYWARPAWLDRVVFRVVKDATVAYQLLLQQEFDLYTVLTPQQWGQEMPMSAALRQSYNRNRFFFPNYSWIGWNELRPMFSDARVRLAMTYLLDREGIREQYLLGVNRTTTCHFPPESTSCDPSLTPRAWDPQRGLALLDEAGWKDHDGDGLRDKDGVPFRFSYLAVASSEFAVRLGAYMQSELKRYGIDMRVRRVDWSIYSDLIRHHQFDACMLSWGWNDVANDPYTVWHSSQSKDGSNYISFHNARADELIEQARSELDDNRRAGLYREFGRVLYDEGPYTFLYNRPQLDVLKKTVHGVHASVAWYDLQDVWIGPAAN